ncbi:MAG: hypothetical protein K5892_02290 [Acholeplasmatales bacterium]|nr:hypothetical protein [Acholeplasmatales bacterium]
MLDKMEIDTNSIGKCGEFFVAGELIRHQLSIAFTPKGAKKYDILAINDITGRQFAIQVKTTLFGTDTWIMNRDKALESKGENIFYIFVHLHELNNPDYYIIPNNIVVDYFNNSKHSKKTFDLCKEYEKYKSAWDLLM